MESLDLKETTGIQEIPKSNYNKDIILLWNHIKYLISNATTETGINYSYESLINLLYYESTTFITEIIKVTDCLYENWVKKLNNNTIDEISFKLLNLLEIDDNRTNKYLFDIIKTILIKECKNYGINTELVN